MPATLRELWMSGREGTLCPLEQLRAWALRQVYLEEGYAEKGLYVKIAAKVQKVGGGAPGPDAVRKLLLAMVADPDWHPGKTSEAPRGRKRALSPQARGTIKRCAEALKKGHLEPTYPLILARCPNATRNPATGEPVDKRAVYEVFRTQCYDEGAEVPWAHVARQQKVALSPAVQAKRLAWAEHMTQDVAHTEAWYYRNVVWTDVCHSLLPRTEAKAREQALARKAGKGWISGDCKRYSRNLRGKREALRQNSWGVEKVWWAPVLARGKLHVDLLPETFLGERPDSIQEVVAKIPAMLRARCRRGPKPRTVMTDRGPGFYHAAIGKITAQYRDALREHGLRPLMGEDASRQAGDSQEVMLHETAVAWLRRRLALTVPARPWLETREAYGKRLKAQAAYLNARCDVEGLCRAFPGRLRELLDNAGDRLSA